MSNAIHSPAEAVTDSEQALRYIKEGNARFVENRGITRDTNAEDRRVLKSGQKPFAAVITCADSRVAPEIYLDQKLGDIFVIRNAGNIADKTVLGNVEYAVEHLKTPLVLVIGHSCCGAVTGALSREEFTGELSGIIETIGGAIEGCKDLGAAVTANAKNSAEVIKANAVVKARGAKVIAACYDIETGIVEFLEK